jgi:hypothetical protein
MGEQLQKGCKSTKANRKQPVLLLKKLKPLFLLQNSVHFFGNFYATLRDGFLGLFIAKINILSN